MPLNKVFLYADSVVRLNSYRRKEEVSDLINGIAIALTGKGYDEYLKSLGAHNGSGRHK